MLKTWANKLNGRDIEGAWLLTPEERKQAKRQKILVTYEVCGDLATAEGVAVFNSYRDETHYFNNSSMQRIESKCTCECPYFQEQVKDAHKIEVLHHPRRFITNLHHECFELNSPLGKRKGIVVAMITQDRAINERKASNEN